MAPAASRSAPRLFAVASCNDARVHDCAWGIDAALPLVWCGKRSGGLWVMGEQHMRMLVLYAADTRLSPRDFVPINTIWRTIRAARVYAYDLSVSPPEWVEHALACEDVQPGSSAPLRVLAPPQVLADLLDFGPARLNAESLFELSRSWSL